MTDAAGDPLSVIAWDGAGLVPVVAQEVGSGDVLMVAYADREAVRRTLESGEAHYFSRSRGEPWHKGATSGNVQEVAEVRYDCDGDTLLYRVRPAGPACHTGRRSCFFRVLGGGGEAVSLTDPRGPVGIGAVAGMLERVVAARLRERPEGSYVRGLAERGAGYVGQKVIEEAGETVVAALQDEDEALLGEAADLLFHLSVLLALRGVSLDDVAAVLASRHRERDDAGGARDDGDDGDDAGGASGA